MSVEETKNNSEDASVEASELAKELDAYQSKVVRFLSIAIVLFALVLCLVVIGYVNVSRTISPSDVANGGAELAAHEVDDDFNPLYEPTHLMPLPFGVKARNQCLLKCFAPNVDKMLCAKGCDKLASLDYGHLVRSVDVDSAALAKKIAGDCVDLHAKGEKTGPRVEWQEFVAAAQKFLRETRPELELYRKAQVVNRFVAAEALQKNLLFPEGQGALELQMTSQFLAALCLRQSIATTQLAVIEAASAGDVFGEKFYRKVEDGLLLALAPLEESANSLFQKIATPPASSKDAADEKAGGEK